MPEPVTPTAASGEGTPPVATENGNDPAQNGNGSNGNNGIPDFDPSKLSDEQINKVLEDQRLWKTDRLSQLREQAKKGKDYESEKAKLAEAEAIKKGEFDKVLAERDAKIQELSDKLTTGQLDNVIREALAKEGVTNANAGLKLIDRSKLKMSEDGQLEGLEEAMKSFATQYPELLKTNTASVGNPTNPSSVPTGEPVKMSDMRNPAWFNDPANAETIKQVQNGKVSIVND